MIKISKFWERIEEYPIAKLMLFVFFFALSERLIVNLVFFLRWGFHTVSGIELWFYYGVAKGTFDLYSAWDPSWWILKTLGFLFSGQALLYSVYLVSSLSSALNSALFCLLVSELHNKKTGFLAGLIYSSMVLPMFNSAGTVTHDIFAYPYLILSLYGILMAFKRRGLIKIPFLLLCLIALFLGRNVGPTIFVAMGTIIIYLFWQGVVFFLSSRADRRYLSLFLFLILVLYLIYYGSMELFGAAHFSTLLIAAGCVTGYFFLWQAVRSFFLQKESAGYLPVVLFLLITIVLVTLLHYYVMPPLMERTFDRALEERGIDVRKQIQAGSGDLLASSLGDYWLRFNFLLFFLPVGLWVALKKKDMLGWALILAAFLASRAADRGTRPLTFGFALMGALAFVNWKASFQWILAVWMGFIIGLFGGKYSTEYAVFFPVAALLIFYSLQWPRRSKSASPNWMLFFITVAWLVAGAVLGAKFFYAKNARTPEAIAQIKSISRYWTVQSCLLVPVLLLFLDAFLGKPRAPKSKKDRDEIAARRWFNRGEIQFISRVAVAALAFCLLLVVAKYVALLEGDNLFKPETIWFDMENFLWKNLYIIVPAAAGALIFIWRWPRRNEEGKKFLTGVAVVCWLFATVIPSMNQTAKSTEGEYRAYKWLSENVSAGRIFVPWSDGYMAEVVSGLTSELSPHNIDFVLPRVYWRSEEEANQVLKGEGINYVLVSSKYFNLQAYNPKTGEFQYSFSPDIIYQPQKVGIKTLDKLKETALFKMLYRPREMKHFQLLRVERDERVGENYLIYRVIP